jgi:hypothetical protein
MFEIFILRWSLKEECDEIKVVNFFYLKNDTINCCTITLNHDEFKEFKSNKNKNKFLEKVITDETFILNENIEHIITLDDFVKRYGLEYKIRNYRIKKIIKKNNDYFKSLDNFSSLTSEISSKCSLKDKSGTGNPS